MARPAVLLWLVALAASASALPSASASARSLLVSASSDAGDDKPDLDALMERFDESGDGQLSEKEFEELFVEMFEDSHAAHGGEEEDHDADHPEIKVSHPKDEDGKCFDPHAIIEAADMNADDSLNATELTRAATVLADMALEKCKIEEEKCEKLDPGMQWLAALLSGVVISLLSLVTVALFPVAKNKMVMNPMLAFAVGALVGDAILHLIPSSLGVHGHDETETESDDEKAFLGPATVTLVGILIFFALERQLSHFHSHSHNHDGNVSESGDDDDDHDLDSSIEAEKRAARREQGANFRTKQTARTTSSDRDDDDDDDSDDDSGLDDSSTDDSAENSDSDSSSSLSPVPADGVVSLDSTQSTTDSTSNLPWFKKLQYEPLGYMSLIADGLHNFVDGIAIGASFTVSFSAGMATAVAVFFHELPQELSEFTILIRSGFSKKKAVLWNLITGFTNVVGCVIGLLIGQAAGDANKYIVAFIAGGFLYIALSDMVTELLQDRGAKQTLIQCFAILTGFALMLILALFAEDIKIECEKEGAHDGH